MFRVSRPAIYSTALAAAFVISMSVAAGLTTTQVATGIQARVAEARTVEVLQATATRIAEQKQNTLVISTTIQDAPETIVSNDSAIPLHEAPTAQVEALNPPVTIYPQPLQPTSTNVPPVPADVTADIDTQDTQRSTGAATAATAASNTPLPFPIITDTPTPEATSDETLIVVTLELLATATYAPTLTLTPEPPPTPQPTDAPKATIAPTPTNTVEPTQTPAPIPTETATQMATVEPSATSVLISPIATPTIEPSATEEATAAP